MALPISGGGITMGMKAAHHQVVGGGAGGQAPALLANGNQLAAARHLLQQLLKFTPRSAFQPQIVDKLFESSRMLGLLADVTEYLLFAQHSSFTVTLS
jgi:hypothetical protein